METTSSIDKWNVPSGSASSPIAKFSYRFCGPFRWYQGSKLRKVVDEFRSLPLRILDLFSGPHSQRWVGLESPYPPGYGRENPCAEYMYVAACNDCIQQLRRENRWFGSMDMRIAAESFRLGVAFERDRTDSLKGSVFPEPFSTPRGYDKCHEDETAVSRVQSI
jgi:hypothetical protein